MSFDLKRCAGGLLIFAALGAMPSSSLAQTNSEPAYLEIVLDASGSMLGQIKGETKIALAKKMLGAFIQGVESKDNNLVAVRTFGADTGKCEDIRLKLDFYKKDTQRLQSIVGEISPRNLARTPLAEVGREIFEKVIAVASGEKTKSELQGYGDEEFSPWAIGPVL